jgi:hypothetical protein
MATPVSNAVPVDPHPFVAGLAQGSRWVFSGEPVLTYSEHDEPYTNSLWNVRLSQAVASAFAAWGDVADIAFELRSAPPDIRKSDADIAVALLSDLEPQPFVGVGLYPDPAFADPYLLAIGSSREEWPRIEGDIGLRVGSGFTDSLAPGGFGFLVVLHEIGHALGLKHPFDNGGSGRPTFAELGIAEFNSSFMTVMSYRLASPYAQFGHPATPMPLDVKALQAIYGADRAHRTGDDVYRLVEDGVLKTIWDAGGIDTLDASAVRASAVSIDLRAGAFSQHGPFSYTAIAFDVEMENAVGSAFGDVITGNGSANRIDGRGGNDRLEGAGGDDVLRGGGGDDTIAGGEGSDRADYAGAFRRHDVSRDGASAATVTGPEGIDSVTSIEKLGFVDGTLTFDSRDHLAAAYRLYFAALDRAPDTLGLNFHSAQLDAGASLSDVAAAILSSPEFDAIAPTQHDAQFVALLYRNALDRPATPDEIAFHVGRLQSGLTRADVVVGFSESAEHVAKHIDAVNAGLWDIDEGLASVARLYFGMLGRTPESDGLAFYAQALTRGLTLEQVANAFADSPEFQAKYRPLDDTAYVLRLYANMRDGPPAPAEVAFHLDRLIAGASRGDVAAGFTEAPEYQITTLALIDHGIAVADAGFALA